MEIKIGGKVILLSEAIKLISIVSPNDKTGGGSQEINSFFSFTDLRVAA